MGTEWYQGSDGVDYPIETEDRIPAVPADDQDQPTALYLDLPFYDAVGMVRRAVMNARMGCGDLPINWAYLFGQVDTLRKDLEQLRDHRCTWSENDYCTVCGADGRA